MKRKIMMLALAGLLTVTGMPGTVLASQTDNRAVTALMDVRGTTCRLFDQ